MRMNRFFWCCLAGPLGLGAPASAQVIRYEFPVTGAQEVPPVSTTADAQATVVLDMSNLRADVYCTFMGLSSAITAAHIHTGAIGVNGPVVVPLAATAGTTGQIAQSQVTLTAATAQAIASGGAYINLHSTNHPAGEVRGQILAQPACNLVTWTSNTQARFGNIVNNALGGARVQSVGQCVLMVTDIGSTNTDGVRLVLPATTPFTFATLSCPNMQLSRQGSKVTMRAVDATGAPIAITTSENIDGTNMQIDFDWSPVGATRYTVELFHRGGLVGRFAGLAQARVSHAAADSEEYN